MSTKILKGDCREVLRTLPDQSVHCCVTSPPYFGLRDYGTAKWDGGDPDCEHVKGTAASKTSTLKNDGRANFGSNDYEHAIKVPYKDECRDCGATRIDSQIGLEATPDAFVAEMVAVFREVRRVLRDDGTLWLNLGDSYSGSGKGGNPGNSEHIKQKTNAGSLGVRDRIQDTPGLKAKDLIGIPWRVAFALQADGWYLRQDIIWSKPNPMPESVTDRCTKAHEYIFLMSKSSRYFYDAASIAEKAIYSNITGMDGSGFKDPQSFAGKHSEAKIFGARTEIAGPDDGKRNKRSIWHVATQGFPEAHFATFPPDLIEPCIKAGCPAGGTVLDPFGGAGTTGLVADRLGRDAILIELNPEYADMARRRIIGDAPLFAEAMF